jgi:ribosomal protein S27AE
VTDDHITPIWAPRVRQNKISELYENDAQGIYDDALIDDVGYALRARCQSFIEANEARDGKTPCPRCGETVLHKGHKDEVLRCRCGWELPWGVYFETIQHKQLSGAEPVLRLFEDFVNRYPTAQENREKVFLIDQLLHGFHWYYTGNSPTRPVAINLIEGQLWQVIEFLDNLSYSEKSTPGTRETKAEWDTNIQPALGWRCKTRE